MIGDVNADIVKEWEYINVIWAKTNHEESKENGDVVIYFAKDGNLTIRN